MLFKNDTGKPVKARRGTHLYHWITVKPDQIVDLPQYQGMALKLTQVQQKEESAEEKTVEETIKDPVKEAEAYKAKLMSIKGVGEKTVKDLLRIYPTEQSLLDAMKKGELPIKDNQAKKIRKEYQA